MWVADKQDLLDGQHSLAQPMVEKKDRKKMKFGLVVIYSRIELDWS